MTNSTLKAVRYKQMFINNEFILIEFHYIWIIIL